MPPISLTASSRTHWGVYLSSLLDAARCGIELQDDELNLFTVGFSVGEMISDRHQKEQGAAASSSRSTVRAETSSKNLFQKPNEYGHTREHRKNTAKGLVEMFPKGCSGVKVMGTPVLGTNDCPFHRICPSKHRPSIS